MVRIAPDAAPVLIAAAAVFIAALAWTLGSQVPATALPDPGSDAPPVPTWSAAVPHIGPLAAYDVNRVDPFVPYADRVRQAQTGTAPPPPPPPAPKQSHTPVPVPRPVVRPWSPQPAASTPASAPRCIGFLRSPDGARRLEVRRSDGSVVFLEPGRVESGWTLLRLEDGGIAVFRDPAGIEQALPVGADR